MKSLVPCLFVSLLIAGSVVTSRAQTIGAEAEFQGEILTRGPVHEAFAGVVDYNPEAGLIVDVQPPEPIEEMPPEERPVDADTAWIPGYWAWDDERNDFIWISGTWRVLPPGRAWISGYWGDTGRGWQWVSGYWADAERRDVTYLAPPPETLESGPSSPAPSPNFSWVPGYWEWRGGRYLWRPGYWIEGRTDWVWVPSYYVWTPRGHVFVEGYWDYTPVERGLLFAPVYYADHRRPRSYYRPSIVINVALISEHLFLRPRYSHYYFGDYYDNRYESSGFFAAFTYQSSRRGYDPFYSHSRWRNRDDRDWDRRHRESYDYRRSHVDARPPRVWSGTTITVNVNQNITQYGGYGGRQSVTYAQPIQQYARSNDSPIRVERAATDNFQQEVQVARQVQEQRAQRRTMEAQSRETSTMQRQGSRDYPMGTSSQQQTTMSVQSAPVALPTSPIVAREGGSRRQPPPRAQSSRREDAMQDRRVERQGPQPDQRQRDVVQEQTVIGAPPTQAPRYEAPRGPDRGLRADNSAAVEARRLEEQAQLEEQRQAQEAARRNGPQRRDQIGADTRQVYPNQPQPRVNEPQGRDWAEERRRAIEADQRAMQQPSQERAMQQPQSRQVEPITDEQLRRDQERRGQQRDQERQAQQQRADERYQQAEAQQQAREQQGRAAEQERVQQSRAAEQQRAQQAQAMEQERAQQSRAAEVQAREQQARAVEQERAQQNRAAEQAREQQARVAEQQQAREQQARAAEQERAQQAQAREQQARMAEQERAQQARAAEQAREQQARAAQQAEAARQKASPNRDQKQPPKKSKEEIEEEERQKRKGG